MMLLIYCSRFLHNGVDLLLMIYCRRLPDFEEPPMGCEMLRRALHDGAYSLLRIALHDGVFLLLRIALHDAFHLLLRISVWVTCRLRSAPSVIFLCLH